MDASALGREVDFASTICPQEQCRVDRDGLIIFSDANHLTATYNRTLADPLAGEITPMLAERR